MPESDLAPGKEGISCQVLMKRLGFFSNVCFLWSFPDLIIMPQFIICCIFIFYTFSKCSLVSAFFSCPKETLCLFLAICFTVVFCFVIYFDCAIVLLLLVHFDYILLCQLIYTEISLFTENVVYEMVTKGGDTGQVLN